MSKNVKPTKHENWNRKIWFIRCPVGNAIEIAISKGWLRNEFYFHNHVVPGISDRGLEALEVQKRFLKEEGFIKNDFNINSWVDRSFLEAALAE